MAQSDQLLDTERPPSPCCFLYCFLCRIRFTFYTRDRSCELSSGCLLNSMGNLVSDYLVATGSKSKKSCTEASTSVDESVTVRRRNRIGQHGVTF